MRSDTTTSEGKRRRREPSAGEPAPGADMPGRHEATLGAACTRLSRMATRLLGADAVAVIHSDQGRPLLLGASGLPEAITAWGNSPLALSLADPAGDGREPLRIRDVDEHDLLAGDRLRSEFGFRAFLSLPLLLESGAVGTLCALHHEPRPWTDDDVDALREVGDSMLTEIRLRGSLKRIRSVELATTETERQSLVALVDDLDAVVTERDLATGAFTYVSRKAEALFGYPVERWLDEPDFWSEVALHPEDRDYVKAELESAVGNRTSQVLEHRVVTADGRVLWVRDLVRVLADQTGEPRLLRGVMTDVTAARAARQALEQRNQDLVFLQELALLSNESPSLERSLRSALARLCKHLGWDLAHIFLAERNGGDHLHPTGIWSDDADRFARFKEATAEIVFPNGEGLPGRIHRAAEPCWIPSLAADPDFPRSEAAQDSGLVSGFAFPAVSGSTVTAVIELYATEPRQPDQRTAELAIHAGSVLARILERERAQEELRESELRTRQILEHAHEAFISIDGDSTVLDWNLESERTFGWSREEAMGRALPELIIPPEHREAHRVGIERFLETGEGPLLGRVIEIEGQTRDGSRVPLELSITPLRTGSTLVFNAFLRDITERRSAEEDRRRRERQLAEAQRLARLGSWEWDMENGAITWSEELHRLFGTDPETFHPTFQAYLERMHPGDRDLAESVIAASAETGEDFMFEHRALRADGTTRTLLCQGRMVADPEGRLVRMMGTAQDITDRKALEAKERQLATEQAARSQAEEAEERVRNILESITDAFFALDREWRFTYVNPEGEAILGRPGEEIIGRSLLEELPETAGTAFEENYRRAMETGEPVEFEEFYEPLDSWFEVRAYPSEAGLSVYLHDITDRREAEARLRASEARYRFLSDSIPQQVWTARADGTLDYVNKVVVEFTGHDSQEILERGWEGVVHPDDLEAFHKRWQAALTSGAPFETEFRLRDGDGNHRWHLARAQPQRTADGTIIKWFGTNTYVHDQKELEEARDQALEDLERVTHLLSSERSHLEEQATELQRTMRALRRSNEELDQFAYVASHDLKAPLRGIANLAQWLADDLQESLTDDTREYLELLENRVHRMEGLIDGILQYSRAGRKREPPKEVDVAALVREVLDMADPPEHFRIRTEGYFPVIMAEKTPLQQVFLNLIGNALKHAASEDPEVVVSCTDEGSEWVEFSVSDNGPGIAPEYHDRIWTIFQTLKPRDEVEGTGIGLSVVKRSVEGQGGHVWVESEEGAGATFRFLWPRTPKGGEHGAP